MFHFFCKPDLLLPITSNEGPSSSSTFPIYSSPSVFFNFCKNLILNSFHLIVMAPSYLFSMFLVKILYFYYPAMSNFVCLINVAQIISLFGVICISSISRVCDSAYVSLVPFYIFRESFKSHLSICFSFSLFWMFIQIILKSFILLVALQFFLLTEYMNRTF